MVKLDGKIALVHGGTGGLGKSVVNRLWEDGATVIATHSGSNKSLEWIEKYSRRHSRLIFRQVNTTRSADVNDFFDGIKKEFHGIDILCNLVGGIVGTKNIEEVTDEEWNRMISLNLETSFYSMRSSLPIMKKRKFGRIINIAAQTGIRPEGKKVPYSVSKAALIALTKAASEEIDGQECNITINAIAPTIILTEENKQWGKPEDFATWVTPEKISETISFLCSESANAINGQIIQMDGKVS